MRVLINGAGIAGPTLAYWLHRLGHRPTLVEEAPAPRRGGYAVDFWGAGFDVAERMGIVPELRCQGYHFREVRAVRRDGGRIASFAPSDFIGAGDRYVTIARSDLAAAIHGALEGGVETVFGDTVAAIDDDGDRVHVTFRSGAPGSSTSWSAPTACTRRCAAWPSAPSSGLKTASGSPWPPSRWRAIARGTSSSP